MISLKSEEKKEKKNYDKFPRKTRNKFNTVFKHFNFSPASKAKYCKILSYLAML